MSAVLDIAESMSDLTKQFNSYLVSSSYSTYNDFTVKLDNNTTYMPSLILVRDPLKITGKVCIGAPDLAVEIWSSSTSGVDKINRFNGYLQAKVQEYWTIEPDTQIIFTFQLKDGEYVAKSYGRNSVVPVGILPGFEVTMFQDSERTYE